MKNLSETIRNRRKQRRLSQGELGKAVGCSQTAISQLETGTLSAVSSDTLITVINHLGLDPELMHEPEAFERPVRSAFCSKALCPANRPFLLADQVRFFPRFFTVPVESSPFCPGCGTELIDHCPNNDCRAPISQGSACCTHCGGSLVPLPESLVDLPDPKEFVKELLLEQAPFSFPDELMMPAPAAKAIPKNEKAVGA